MKALIATCAAVLCGLAWVTGCREAASTDPVPPHETFTVMSQALQEERVINVWTPPGYAESEAAYPVLYMPDGGIGEDFPHIANTLADLVAQGGIAPLILVGIENTERRRDLTGPSTVAADAEIAPLDDGASRFREFIGGELFPEIARRFRVDDRRAIVGESAAGLFVVETFFLAPGMFDIHLAMDPAIYWNDHDLVRKAVERLQALPARPTRLWFAASDAEMINVWTDELAKILAAHAPANLAWTYVPQPNEQHNTIFRATKERAFRWGLWAPEGDSGAR